MSRERRHSGPCLDCSLSPPVGDNFVLKIGNTSRGASSHIEAGFPGSASSCVDPDSLAVGRGPRPVAQERVSKAQKYFSKEVLVPRKPNSKPWPCSGPPPSPGSRQARPPPASVASSEHRHGRGRGILSEGILQPADQGWERPRKLPGGCASSPAAT